MNVCVLGAGAIGGWVAAKLSQGGNKVVALGSSGRIPSIRITERDVEQSVAFQSFDGSADLLIVAVKATALDYAVRVAAERIDEKTLILPMLNGVPWWFVDGAPLKSVDPNGIVATVLPPSQLIGCVVHASCYRTGPAEVLVKHSDKIILGEPQGGRSDRVASLCRAFEAAGIRVEASTDVRRSIWYKLWGNATINPLSALTRATCDRILADAECRAWMLEGMAELAAIGAAIGCPISESGEDRMAVTARLGAFKTSMLQDVEAGRPIELEALLGAPREIAANLGIGTPSLDRLYEVTRLMAESLALI